MDLYIENHSKPWLLPSSIKVCFLCLFPAIQIEWDYSWLSHERAPGTTHRIIAEFQDLKAMNIWRVDDIDI